MTKLFLVTLYLIFQIFTIHAQALEKHNYVFLRIGGAAPYYSINYSLIGLEQNYFIWNPAVGVGFIQKHSFNSFVDLNPEHNYIPIVFSNEFNFQMFSPNNYVNFGFGITTPCNSKLYEIGDSFWFDTFFNTSFGYNYVSDNYVMGIKYSPIITTSFLDSMLSGNASFWSGLYIEQWFEVNFGIRL